MPDLLTHVLVAYFLARVASWRYRWLTTPFVTVVMTGAVIPDLTKIGLVIPSGEVQSAIGLPFSWFPLHTVGGVVVSVLAGILLVPRSHRLRVGGLLALGAATHIVLDSLLRKPTGTSDPMLWPLSWYRPPTPGFYTSVDAWPTVLALLLAACVWAASRHVDGNRAE